MTPKTVNKAQRLKKFLLEWTHFPSLKTSSNLVKVKRILRILFSCYVMHVVHADQVKHIKLAWAWRKSLSSLSSHVPVDPALPLCPPTIPNVLNTWRKRASLSCDGTEGLQQMWLLKCKSRMCRCNRQGGLQHIPLDVQHTWHKSLPPAAITVGSRALLIIGYE